MRDFGERRREGGRRVSKVGVIIDPHITDRHRCRRDNFLEATIEKLDYVAKNNDYVIICGDLFHTNSNSNYIFYKMYKFFMKYEGKFYCIAGNHDLLHNNINMLEKTTIGSLALTGAIKLFFDKFTIGNANFVVSNVIKDMTKIPVDETNSSVLIGHNYLEMEGCPKESFTKDEIRALKYKLVFLGHEHKPYEEEFLGESTLIRMGSLTRIDTQPYNKERKIYYYQLDTDTLDYERLEVPSKPAEEVFTEEAFQRIGRKKEEISFIKIGDVLAKFRKRDTGVNSLHAKLVKIANQKEIEYIKALHELNGVRYF